MAAGEGVVAAQIHTLIPEDREVISTNVYFEWVLTNLRNRFTSTSQFRHFAELACECLLREVVNKGLIPFESIDVTTPLDERIENGGVHIETNTVTAVSMYSICLPACHV